MGKAVCGYTMLQHNPHWKPEMVLHENRKFKQSVQSKE